MIKSKEFSIKENFKAEITKMEFISHKRDKIKLDDIFVFPNIIHEADNDNFQVANFDELWSTGNHILLRGNERIGKTTICKKLFLECVSKNIPVVMISGQEITSPKNHDAPIKKNFNEQFRGNYNLWKKKKKKTLIIDDLDSRSQLQFLDFAKDLFDRIFITTSEDEYLSYFKDEEKLASYELLAVKSFTHSKQEDLIKLWKSLNNSGVRQERINHGEIDQIEDRLNSIILDNRIVPRYPFYILSILQTYESFMPQNMQITAYGHCYQALITAQLVKSGIEKEDIDSAFNFLTQFAFEIFRFRTSSREKDYLTANFTEFLHKYEKQFLIKETVVNRLKSGGIVTVNKHGEYKLSYSFVYYFFLGRFFAQNYKQQESVLEQLAEESYLLDNRYVLIFTIHHTNDDDLIDTILLHTMDAMANISIAKLTTIETKPLISALSKLPHNIISQQPVEIAREEEKKLKDAAEAVEPVSYKERHGVEDVNSLYRSLKNMEILGQILRNKYGSFPKDKLQEIVTTVVNAGLRIVTLITNNENMCALEDFLVKKLEKSENKKNKEKREELLRKQFRALCFFLMAGIIGKIVVSIRKPELAEIVASACEEINTPAYQLIGFFFVLATTKENLKKDDVDKLGILFKTLDKDGNEVVKRLLSIATQDYINKHEVPYQLRQRIHKLLGLRYRPNPRLQK